MRKKRLIVGNWKMNPLSLKEAGRLWRDMLQNISSTKKTEVVICPPHVFADRLGKMGRKVILGAQDAFFGEVGAFTGEVSAAMLYEMGARYVIFGHSERRALGESGETINKKIKSALTVGIRPILCVGEQTRDENHGYFNIVKAQLEENLKGTPKNVIDKVIIAYEPVWAISSTPGRRDASAEDAHEMVIFIRKVLSDQFGRDASAIKILYGGSVNDRDAEEFLIRGGVDGLLVGKSSLSPEKFSKIIKISEKLK